MSRFCDDTMQGLLEAVPIEKGETPIERRTDMPAPTFSVVDKRKTASYINNGTKKHSPLLKLFSNMVNALGYELQIVKKSHI